ncbi:major facilitator superfamily domain-containing protein [Exophiala viscosa]|uniref:Major facilitator superfamily domain-containing protein n=1 Tax=Exophiala viscosa TaxID=2486360 RepID=A0AAN6DP50_9EURO|nr:major facilitator superfamily domain-containing protein [Exophiala viscosa]
MAEKGVQTSKIADNEEVKGVTASPLATADVEDLQNDLKDPSLGSTPQHPFSTPESAQYWSDVYETAKYEGRHRFDPTCRWSATEEKRLVRKLDWRIMAWVWVMFSSLDLVRRNVNPAISDNMLDELDMNTNDFNTGQTIYLTSFLAAELPGGLLSKKIGPDVMTPIAICIWGVICACQCMIKDRTGFFITRALLGFSQGGFIPEMVLYLSYFFKSNELPIRLSIFWTAIPLTQIIGSLLAAGFLKMRGLHDWSGWQWLFLIEGLMSVTVGLVTFVVMPASITESGHILRGKASSLHGKTGWFTEREEKIGVNRILRDDPSKGDMNNRQYVSLQGIWQAVKDIDLWPTYMLGIVAFIPFQPAANYLSLTLRNLGYTVFEANMLAIPGYTLFFINILTVVWLSERYRERLIFGATSNFWVLPFLIALVTIPSSASPWVRYALLTGVNGEPYTHAILVGMISRNANSVGTRAVSAAVYNICYQIGSIVAVNVYRNDDKPYYYRGNKILVGLASANIVLFFLAKLYYIKRNQQKERQWRLLSDFDQANYLSTTKDTGTKRLDIRFAH